MKDKRREFKNGTGKSYISGKGYAGRREDARGKEYRNEEENTAGRENTAGEGNAAGGENTAGEENAAEKENTIEGRNAVIEAFRSGRTIDKVYILDGCQDGPVNTIKREAKKHAVIVKYVARQRLDQMSQTGKHQGVIAVTAAYSYGEVEDMLAIAEQKGEPPFLILLDNIEDPHNLGAIIRTANLAGAHGVIIPKNRAAGLTAVAARTSAGALNYTPVARVTNMSRTIKDLKQKGMWFVCADMDGTAMYDLNLTGPIGLVIGSEGEGVSRLVKESCDMTASIPMKGDIDSLNASVAAGVLSYEIVRQRLKKQGSGKKWEKQTEC